MSIRLHIVDTADFWMRRILESVAKDFRAVPDFYYNNLPRVGCRKLRRW